MRLLRLDDPRIFDLAAEWLTRPENYQWLDFGQGVQRVTPVTLKVMSQRDIHELRVFTTDEDNPIGVVGLSNVDRQFKTGSPWCVLGDKTYAGKGHTTRAVSKILSVGFYEIGLCSVMAWTLETNTPAIQLMKRLNFRFIGRQRQCHYVNGRALDRLLFDLLAEEHKEI